jgi:type VI secretion system secreted protein VgrG
MANDWDQPASMSLEIEGHAGSRPRLSSAWIEEALGRPTEATFDFAFDAEVSIDPADLLGRAATIRWTNGGLERAATGVVVAIKERAGVDGGLAFTARLVHRLATLERGRWCRVFTDADLPAIVRRVLTERGFNEDPDFRLALGEVHAKRPLVVQYHESDLAFLARVLAEQGASFRIDGEVEQETVVFIDARSEPPRLPRAALRLAAQLGLGPEDGQVETASLSQASRLESVRLRDHRFRSPTDRAEARKGSEAKGAVGEEYLYLDEDLPQAEIESLAARRLEAAHGDGEVYRFDTIAPSLAAGASFEVEDHRHGGAYSATYLAVSVSHGLVAIESPGGSDDRVVRYENRCVAVRSGTPWRPPPAPEAPRIHGLQAAIVVGDRDGDLNVDEHGRIQLRFRWQVEKADHPAPWVRIAHPWAGRGFGMIALPRVGHEVLLAFLDGDPDRPVVVGSLFNGESVPPETLPAHASRMVIRSKSLGKDDSVYNELHLEDRAGEELVYLRAARDMLSEVVRDQTTLVARDATLEVKRHESSRIKGDRKASIVAKDSVEAREIELVASTSITLRCGGSTITITPTGVDIKAPIIKLNC